MALRISSFLSHLSSHISSHSSPLSDPQATTHSSPSTINPSRRPQSPFMPPPSSHRPSLQDLNSNNRPTPLLNDTVIIPNPKSGRDACLWRNILEIMLVCEIEKEFGLLVCNFIWNSWWCGLVVSGLFVCMFVVSDLLVCGFVILDEG